MKMMEMNHQLRSSRVYQVVYLALMMII